MKKEWREASEILGASTKQYWRMVALPILFPSVLGATLLLFANSFGAIATAPEYRLVALPTDPPKPGLVRVGPGGASIATEVWRLPTDAYGSFVHQVSWFDTDYYKRWDWG